MSILFSLTGSIQPSTFSFFQTNLNEFDKFKKSNEYKINNLEPILIQEDEGYVGTISNYYDPKQYQLNITNGKKSPLNPNPGKQDNAFLNSYNEVAVIKGSIKFINNFITPTLTDSKTQKALYESFVKFYINQFGLNELISRYLKNIISGKILWRNKYGFNKLIDIEMKSSSGINRYKFDTSNLHINNTDTKLFEDDIQNSSFENLVEALSSAIKNQDTFAILNIQYFVELGTGANVFPSQSFLNLDEKPDGKGRCLAYQVINKKDKQAILHSQKIGNAIRTIDTWYGSDTEAIPVEAYGVVVTQREAFRPSGQNSFYDFFEPKKFETFVNNYTTQKEGDKHYLMSMFLKGGVFGV